MPVLIAIAALAVLALIFGPQLWVQRTMQAHSDDRPDYPGSGGELARQLLDSAGLNNVVVEMTEEGDHYDPEAKAVRLSANNYQGRSVTAVAVAAHEVSHALQDRDGYAPLFWRQKLVVHVAGIQRLAMVLIMAAPVVFALVRSPAILLVELLAAFAMMGSIILVHALTLPTEFDASFRRALPILSQYLPARDMPGARKVLKAAAYTYVAAALVSLLDVARWIRILRF